MKKQPKIKKKPVKKVKKGKEKIEYKVPIMPDVV